MQDAREMCAATYPNSLEGKRRNKALTDTDNCCCKGNISSEFLKYFLSVIAFLAFVTCKCIVFTREHETPTTDQTH